MEKYLHPGSSSSTSSLMQAQTPLEKQPKLSQKSPGYTKKQPKLSQKTPSYTKKESSSRNSVSSSLPGSSGETSGKRNLGPGIVCLVFHLLLRYLKKLVLLTLS